MSTTWDRRVGSSESVLRVSPVVPQVRTAEEKAPAGSTLTCAVIIPVCNGGDNFRASLAAVAAAVSPQDEIIVVADGDGDGSWRCAEEMGAQVVHLPASGGPGRARNAGAEIAKSDFLFFVDADVTISPDAIGRIRSTFEADPDLAALIGSYDEAPHELNFHSQYKNLFHHFVHQNGSAEASTFWGACGAIRRDVFLEVGGFDKSYERPCIEDIELGYRLRVMSHKIRLLPDLQVKHLKRWNAPSLIKTDMMDRAVPWTELIWDHFIRRKPRVLNDLNLGLSYRLSLITSFIFLAASIGAFFTLWTLPVVVLSGLAFLFLQVPFFRFFRTKRGLRFAFHALAWRFGYDLYSGVGFCYGSFRYANASTRKILSEAFARLDAVALGTSVGSLWGGGIWTATAILLLKGGNDVGSNLSLLGQFFPGYHATWTGGLIGLLYGFTSGFLFGFCFAFFRNFAMRLHLGSRRVQRFLQRARQAQAPA